MAYYLLIAVSSAIACLGLRLGKRPFFSFAKSSTAVLNVLLDTQRTAEEKQSELIARLSKMLSWFVINLLIACLVVILFLTPIYIYSRLQQTAFETLDMLSWKFWLSMTIGSLSLLLPFQSRSGRNYSDWSILLHELILDNYHLSRVLFGIEKKLFLRSEQPVQKDFVIVTGLARAGTTALTRILYETGQFHSLSYENMPFLLCPNIWQTFYRVRKSNTQTRAHGDGIEIDFNSVEALEEYFFKVFLNDKFVKESALIQHQIDETCYENYLAYQQLIERKKPGSTYLAKNNNFMLRLDSFVRNQTAMKVILVFREPVAHACSLRNQHTNFCRLQREEPFVLEYMNWLGHHEFGLNHKPFCFDGIDDPSDEPLYSSNDFPLDSLDYWMTHWIQYYRFALIHGETDKFIFVDYQDLVDQPQALISRLEQQLDMTLPGPQIPRFQASRYDEEPGCPNLLKLANKTYSALKQRRVTV